MTELDIKTLDELLHKDNRPIGDLKRMIENHGVCFIDGYEEWKAAPTNVASSGRPIEAALSALREFAYIRRSDTAPQLIEDYYRKPDSQPICFFGFNQDTTGNLFVKKMVIQNQEERIEQLIAELAKATKQSDALKEQISNLETEIEAANEKLEQLDAKSSVHDLRAIAIQAWLYTNQSCTRRELWSNMAKVDGTLFQEQHKRTAAERAVDRVNGAFEKRYGVKIEYPDSNN
jgi:hypothetical protein